MKNNSTIARPTLSTIGKRIPPWSVLVILLLTPLLNLQAQDAPGKTDSIASGNTFLFSYFKNNGEDGLHLAWSQDGLKWESVNSDQPLTKPSVGGKLMRDPCIVQGPDGVFHMVWSSGWEDLGFGYASSKDLVHWSEHRWIEVNRDVAGAKNTWAPDLFYDSANKRFVIIYATTIPGAFPDVGKEGDWNHRHYLVTTTDFSTFSKPVLFYNPGFNSIDGTLTQFGDRILLTFKDERPGEKRLYQVIASSLNQPFSQPHKPIIDRDWVEGPSVLKVGNVWRLYFDCYTKGHYGAAESQDGSEWHDITDKLQTPSGMRHGTAFAVPPEILQGLLQRAP